MLFVSIHAPAGGATIAGRYTQKVCTGFNPRARRGRDTPLLPFSRTEGSFNPRARRGRDDLKEDEIQKRLTVSIHAPAGGATYISKKQGEL